MNRPYIKLRISEIELRSATASDIELRELADELSFRKSQRAITLRSELEKRLEGHGGGLGGAPAKKSGAKKKAPPKKSGAKKKAPAKKSGANDAGRTHVGVAGDGWEARYEVLRATFSLEAEVLARWGMTGAMPAEIERLVFDEWRARVTDSPDRYGRTRRRLERDVERLEAERRAEER
jgi:hypothetical protein